MKALFPLSINGEWRTTSESEPIINPYNDKVIARVALGTEPDMEDTIAAAYAARQLLAALTNAARGLALDKIRAGIDSRQDEFASVLCQESGKPIKDARVEVQRAAHVFQIAAEEARRFGGGETIPLDRMESSANRVGVTRRFPAGVVGAITPFNFPLNLVAHKVAPALAVGCPVVLKPAHQAPLCSLLLAEVVAESGLPAGSLNVIHCAPSLGERLATDPRVAVLSFTGSARIGWELKAKANRKRVTLELGGNAGVVIHSDADIAYAAARCVMGAYAYAGQVCISVQRIFVQESVYEAFLEAFLAGAAKLKAGDPMELTTDYGPMLSEAAAQRTEDWVREALEGGARLLLGKGQAEGCFFAPTLLADTPTGCKAYAEEIFAPVATITPYRDFGDALALVNDSAYGLQAGVFTQDINRLFTAFQTLEVGEVIANDVPTYRIDHMPYGGVKGSGFGREGVRYAMEEMSELRLLALNLRQ